MESLDRSEIVDAILSDRHHLVLIPGESGAGKSTIIAEATAVARADRYVSTPYALMWSDPLPEMLLRSLGEIVAEILQNQGVAKQVGDRLAAGLRRLADTQGRELIAAGAKELMAVIRARLGDDVGSELVAAVKALEEASASSIAARLDRVRTKTALEVVVGFFEEVVALADPHPLVVPLDRCEQLNEEGARILADLAEVLPEGAQIWAVFDNGHPIWTNFMSTIKKVSTIVVPGVTGPEIAGLLVASDLDPDLAGDALLQTRGNLLALRAYFGLRSSRLASESQQSNIVIDTIRRLDLLDAATARFALDVALLENPLPDEYMARLAGDDPILAADMMTNLLTVGLLTVHGGSQWIHERHRKIIREHAARDDLSAAAQEVAAVVWDYAQKTSDSAWLVELGKLVSLAREAFPEQPMQAVLRATQAELAVLAALIELSEPSKLVVDAAAVLRYASRSYAVGDGSKLDSLKTLRAGGVVALEQVSEVAVAALLLRGLPFAVAVGRITETFGQFPIPSIASVATHAVMYPRLGTFLDISYGIGQPAMQDLAFQALRITPKPFAGRFATSVLQAPPSALIRALFAGRPIYAAVRFHTETQRDVALDALVGLNVEFLGERFRVTDAASYPTHVVPADRFLRAAERVVGKQLTPTLHRGEIHETLPEPVTLQKAAELRLKTREVLRELSGSTMRSAMELDVPSGLHWSVENDCFLEVEVQGGRDVAISHSHLPAEAWAPGPYRSVHLAEALGLEGDESIRRINVSVPGPTDERIEIDPVLVELGLRRQLASDFNRTQLQIAIEVDDVLIGLIRAAFFGEMRDARTLAARLPILGEERREIPPTARYVAIPRETPQTGWGPGARSTLIWCEGPSTTSQDECHLAIVDGIVREHGLGGTSVEATESHLAELPGFEELHVVRSVHANTMHGIAQLLGYQPDDLDFRAGLRRSLQG